MPEIVLPSLPPEWPPFELPRILYEAQLSATTTGLFDPNTLLHAANPQVHYAAYSLRTPGGAEVGQLVATQAGHPSLDAVDRWRWQSSSVFPTWFQAVPVYGHRHQLPGPYLDHDYGESAFAPMSGAVSPASGAVVWVVARPGEQQGFGHFWRTPTGTRWVVPSTCLVAGRLPPGILLFGATNAAGPFGGVGWSICTNPKL